MTLELWYVDLDDVARRPDALVVVTGPDGAAGNRLPSGLLRQRFLARRAATRHVLSQSYGLAPERLRIVRRCARCGDPDHGRPTLIGVPGDFSVASSGGAAVVAISDHSVGVDLETVLTPEVPAAIMARSVLTQGERDLLASLSPARRARMFLQLWTIKEAVLKADGSGLALDPILVDATTVATEAAGEITVAGRTWTVRSIPPPLQVEADVILALAGTEQLEIRWRSLIW